MKEEKRSTRKGACHSIFQRLEIEEKSGVFSKKTDPGKKLNGILYIWGKNIS